MIRAFRISGNGLVPGEDDLGAAAWIDLVQPSDAERGQVSALVGIELPSRADQEEIEVSSRLYLDGGVPVMTVLLPARSGVDATEIMPVTFIVAADRLVTVRHHNPRPFETFPPRAGRASLGCHNVEQLALGLLEEIIDRLADLTEQAGREIDALSRTVFRPDPAAKTDLQAILRRIGIEDALVMHLRESLLTIERMLGFLVPVMDGRKTGREIRAMVKSHQRDVRTITEQAGFLMQKTGVLLEATLGLINIEQSAIIKIFSVAAVVFLPPTLIASIYGMNFEHMPELDWWFGYPLAVGAMVVSAVLPLVYFRRKGWF
jgi:magnesium transporter